MKSVKKIKKGDAILIASLLVLSAVLILFFYAGRKEGGYAVVTVDGVQTERISLQKEGTYPLNGGTNILLIQNGCARMVEADCPDHICVETGEIRYEGQMIVCLPNKVVVTVEGVKGDADFYIG